LQANVARLKAYTDKLILFPRRRVTKAKVASSKAKSGDSPAALLASAEQLPGSLLPITKPAPVIESVAVTAEMKATKAYQTLRVERMNTRMVGIRAKKAAEAAKEAEEKAKA
jgi:large subunit ribosomal protein L13e